MFWLILTVFTPYIFSLPLLHHINIDGFIFCPDGSGAKSVTVVVTDGNEDKELLRKEFSPADEYCLSVDDFVDIKVCHPQITLFARCLMKGKECVYYQKQAIPVTFMDSSSPFRPSFNATEHNQDACIML